MAFSVHKLELKDGIIFLDGVRVRGIKSYELVQKENDSFAELSLKMDVRTLGDKGAPEFDGSLDESR